MTKDSDSPAQAANAAPSEPPPLASNIGRLLRNASIYGGGSLIMSIIAIGMDPILSYRLTRADFGLLGLAASVTGMLSATYTCGLDGAANRMYYEVEDDPVLRKRTVGTFNTYLLGWLILLTAAQEVYGPWLYAHFFDDLPYDPYGRLVAIGLALSALSAIPRTLWAARENVGKVVSLRVVAGLITAGVLVALLVLTDMGAIAVMIAEVSAPCVLVWIYLHFGWGTFGFAWDRKVLWAGLAFGLPMIVHLTSHWVLNAADRMVIEKLLGRDAVGLYSVAYKGTSIAITINLAINGAYVPQFMRAHGKPEETAFVGNAVTWFLTIAAGASLALVCMGSTLIRLVYSARFADAAPLVPIVSLGGFFQAIYLVSVNGLFYAKKTGRIPLYTALSGVANVLMCLVLIPPLGVMGAAWATAGAYVLLALLVWNGCRNVTRIPFEVPRLTRLFGVFAVLATLAIWVDGRLALGGEVAVKVLLVAAAPVILAATGFLTPDEVELGRARVRRLLGR